MDWLGIASVTPAVSIGLEVVFAAAGIALATFAVYLTVLAVAAHGMRFGAEERAQRPSKRVVVLVPAHNETDHIARCIESLRAQTYPQDLFETVVVADNCTDDTAAVARSAGAEVLVRDRPDLRGKGPALRFGIDEILARPSAPDGIAIVDADSVVEPAFLTILAAPFEAGAHAVQGESLLFEDGSLQTTAFVLGNRVRPAGRAALGLPSKLAGNGMLFSRELLLEHPWDALTSVEDLEYSLKLRRAEVRAVYAPGAIVRSPAAPGPRAAEAQRQRYVGGKLRLARTHVPRLLLEAVRTRRLLLLDTAFELALPPLSLLTAATVGGGVLVGVLAWQDVVQTWLLAPYAVALVSIPLYVLVGLHAGRAPRSAYVALVRVPRFMVEKLAFGRRVRGPGTDTWIRTERPSDSRVPSGD